MPNLGSFACSQEGYKHGFNDVVQMETNLQFLKAIFLQSLQSNI